MKIASRVLSIAACVTLSAASVLAATPPPFEAWVNPQTGHNATGMVNNQARPFLSLQAAISAVSAVIGSQEGVVYAMPGLYSDQSGANGEAFPIVMADRVHVLGYGAKECVVRNTGAAAALINVWIPETPSGAYKMRRPVFDLRGLGHTVNTSLEGLTIQGGDIQVWSRPETTQNARISNCVFDMRKGGSDGLIGPSFGILLTPIYFLPSDSYFPMNYHILNNTFIQGWRRSATVIDVEKCSPNNVAICNVADPVGSDEDLSLRGVSAINIQNNVIRALPGQLATALLGIDASDTTVAIGTTPGPSNAFNPSAVGGVNATGTFTSAIVGLTPMPRVNLNGGAGSADAAFVGEMVTQTQFATLENPYVRDWRILPSSPLVDAGSGPMKNMTSSFLGASNGLTYAELNASCVRAFDWDGEGHGNPRRSGNEVDIGFDESDNLTIAGCYGNDSKSHGLKWHATIQDGNSNRTHITPQSTFVTYYFTTRFLTPGVGWTLSPGSIQGTSAGAPGTLYLDSASPGIMTMGLGTTISTQWLNPVDGNWYAFAELIDHQNDFGPVHPPYHLNGQAVTNVGGVAKLSNLQAEIY